METEPNAGTRMWAFNAIYTREWGDILAAIDMADVLARWIASGLVADEKAPAE